MKLTKLCAIVLTIVILVVIRAHHLPEEDGVLLITENLDTVVNQYEHILVMFSNPNSEKCKHLALELSKAAQTLRSENPPLYLAKLDATLYKELNQKYNVTSVPTMILFSNGQPINYEGGRTASEIVSWTMKNTNSAINVLTSITEVENFKQKFEMVAVYFGREKLDIIRKVSNETEEILFGVCSEESCYGTFGVSPETLVLYNRFGKKRNDLTGNLSEDSLNKFLLNYFSPFVRKFDHRSTNLIFGKSATALILFRDTKSDNAIQLESMFYSIAKSIEDKLVVVITDIKDPLEERFADFFGIKFKDLPTVKIYETKSNESKKYVLEGEITRENVLRFVENWENGKLNRHYRSEEIPQTQEEDVYVIVGKTFGEIVFDNTKDVLVFFYSPTDNMSRRFQRIYSELARKLRHNNHLRIARMNAVENEHEALKLSVYPTLKLWAATKKHSPVEYTGEKTMEGLLNFLQHNSTFPLTVSKDDL